MAEIKALFVVALIYFLPVLCFYTGTVFLFYRVRKIDAVLKEYSVIIAILLIAAISGLLIFNHFGSPYSLYKSNLECFGCNIFPKNW
ncbi:TPA: hypothetical protein MM158_005208 [Klebsiella pneumoniae]|nr:hypothetical protein [Klebsiella pneumoniae]